MKQYYTYIYDFNPQDWNSRYTPSYNFLNKFPQLKWICELIDEIIPEDKINYINENLDRFWYRLWVFEYDNDKLTNLWLNIDYIVSKSQKVLWNHDIEWLNFIETANFIRKWTSLEEIDPNLFKISDKYINISWETIEAKFIDLN